MKKIVLAAIMMMGMSVGHAQDCKIHITSDKDSRVQKCLLVTADDTASDAKADTIQLVDGKAERSLAISKMQMGVFNALSENAATQPQFMLYVPGETMEVHCTADGWSLNGSEFYRQAGEIKKQQDENDRAYRAALVDHNEKVQAEGANKDSLKQAIWKVYTDYIGKKQSIVIDYAKANPDAECVAMWLPYLSDKKALFDVMSDKVKTNSRVSDYIKQLQDEAAAKQRQIESTKAARGNVAVGKMAPDFTLKDINGNDLTMSSLRGKYLILDFWGSWCGWCIKGMPKMKEYYKKYGDKLEILGVDCNDTEDKWKKAVEQHQIPWLHVYNPKNGDVPVMYAVEGYPTKIVIDPEGKIAKIIVGESEDFYNYLDSLFK